MTGVRAALVPLGALVLTTSPPAPAPRVDRTLLDPRIHESSSLVVSARDPRVLWTANDSGDVARIFAVGPDGRTAATYRLAGLVPRDWEAMAPGRDRQGRPVLWVGDIGDNSEIRERGILVHEVEEPNRLRDGVLTPTSFRLRYPDGPHDAETLFVDPDSGRLAVVTKGLLGGAVYLAPERLDPTAPNVLTRVADAPGQVTDGTALPDGRIVLRDYGSAYVYSRLGGPATQVALPDQPQGESIATAPDGRSVYVGSEGRRSKVWSVPLPGRSGGSGSPTAGAAGSAQRGPAQRWLVATGAVAACVAAGYAVAGLRRRRP